MYQLRIGGHNHTLVTKQSQLVPQTKVFMANALHSESEAKAINYSDHSFRTRERIFEYILLTESRMRWVSVQNGPQEIKFLRWLDFHPINHLSKRSSSSSKSCTFIGHVSQQKHGYHYFICQTLFNLTRSMSSAIWKTSCPMGAISISLFLIQKRFRTSIVNIL